MTTTDSSSSRPTLMLINRADDETGGSLRAVVNLADALACVDVRVTITAPIGPRLITTEMLASTRDGVDVRLFQARRLTARFGGSLRQAVWLWRHVREFQDVHLHTIFYLGAVYAALICRLRRVPYYVWPHGTLDRYDIAKHRVAKAVVGPLVVRPVLALAAGTLCTTQREVAALVTYGAQPDNRIVPLPVRPVRRSEIDRVTWRSRVGLPADAFVILFLGRIDPKKGLERLIRALELVGDDRTHLFIAGTAATEEYLASVRKEVTRAGLDDRVKFAGWIEGEARSDALHASDVFALPSDNENFGIAVVEALHAAIPVVISRGVYLAEALDSARAAVVVDKAPEKFAAALRGLLVDAQGAGELGARGAAFADQSFGESAVAQTLLTACEEMTP